MILQTQLVEHFLINISLRIIFLIKIEASSDDLVNQENAAVSSDAVEQKY